MEWNVYYHNFNRKKIEKFNIFDHYRFREDVEKDLEKYKSKDEFAKALRSHLFYYFGSKCEYEVLIGPWIGDGKTAKVDVYSQVMLNFDVFVDYVWTH